MPRPTSWASSCSPTTSATNAGCCIRLPCRPTFQKTRFSGYCPRRNEMPVRIPNDLPARKTLSEENIFVMTTERAVHQDIRPLRIAVLNLMPTKIVTETQILRLLGNSPLQVDITFIRMGTHESKNTPEEHLDAFYESLDEVLHERFDGLIITGAPVETLPFDEVDYWPELVRLMNWSLTNVWSTMHICWGAQAALADMHRRP